MATLKERDPEEYAALCTLYSGATDRINDPDYERVQPPLRRIKRPLPSLMPGV